MTNSVSYINLEVAGMSRHSNVDSSNISRSLNAHCNCVRAYEYQRLEGRVVSVWIREARVSPWPDGELGMLTRGQTVEVYLPPDAFEHTWEAALASTMKQLNLRVPSPPADEQNLAIVGFSIDELTPKPTPSAPRSKLPNAITLGFWLFGAAYICYAIAKYFKFL